MKLNHEEKIKRQAYTSSTPRLYSLEENDLDIGEEKDLVESLVPVDPREDMLRENKLQTIADQNMSRQIPERDSEYNESIA